MIRFAFPVEIDRPVEDVFAFVTDPSRLPEWQTTTVSSVPETAGPLRAGTRLREVHRGPFGRELESLVEVARYEPNRRFDLRILEGPLPLDGNFGFEAVDGRTRIDFAAEGQPSGLLRLAQPLLARTLEKQFRGYFARLKELMEGETPR
jgi:uncharacterized protein YndB with AHSA1/START domain